MIKSITRLYHETPVGYLLISPAKWLYDVYRQLIPEKIFIKQKFKWVFGHELDLDNPITLNEKIQWLKINDRTLLHTLCADKYAVRKYIKDKIGQEYLIPLIYQTSEVASITAKNLPNIPFIIKTNHDSSGGIIVRDKSNINWKSVRRELAKRLKSNYYYYSKEWQYKNIEPCIVVEKLLVENDGSIPSDYKLHCFNGKLVFVQVDLDRQIDHKRNLYDVNWNLIDCQWLYENGEPVDKPLSFRKMQSLAEVIAEDFCYVRVDFYSIGSKNIFWRIDFSFRIWIRGIYPP